MQKLFIPIAIIVVGVIIAGVIAYTNISNNSAETGISLDQAGEKMMAFLNGTILQGQGGASLIEVLEENGLYKVKFEVEGEEIEWRMTKDGNLVFPQVIDVAEFEQLYQREEEASTIGNFSVAGNDICYEDNKPLVYFFGSQSCPHCSWEHPIVEEVMDEFQSQVSFHNNMDSDADMDIFSQFSTGGVPTVVLGCKYYRVGSGESLGEEAEAENLTALVCKLTNSQPEEVCSQVQDLINKI